ncbi:MAG: acyl-CoA thioesterase [Saprospiraceae bacterium]
MSFIWNPPANPIKSPGLLAKIRFPDCDPYGHLNNSRYLDYFLNAREDHLLQAYHFPLCQYSKVTKRGWVVVMNQIAYLKPVYVMDEVFITSSLLACTDKTVDVEMIMWDAKKEKVKSILWLKSVHIDLTTQSAASHTEDVQKFFSELVIPIKEQSWDERVMSMRMQNK